MADAKPSLPVWVANLLVFALLFLGVMAYFLWQIHQARKDFLTHVREHALLVAEVVQLNAQGSMLSQKAAEEILEAFLGNMARFVDYLDQVEPFTPEELAAFADEAGLRGIAIQGDDARNVEGPPQWVSQPLPRCGATASLYHIKEAHMYVFAWRQGSKCIRVGKSDTGIRTLQEHLGLDHVIETLASIPGMKAVKVVPPTQARKEGIGKPGVTITGEGDLRVAEARVPLETGELRVTLDAGYLHRSVGRLWRDFFFFSAALAALGVVLSLILYRYQSAHLREVRQFERKLALERENAALGRAAAAIAHEVKNPLNTLGMGLQRLELEARGLTRDERHQLGLMLDAVKRANSSMNGLLTYARPRQPDMRPVRLDLMVEDILDLYSGRCETAGISLSTEITFRKSISGDPDLLKQVVENLLKNAVEAQPGGGFIHVTVSGQDREVCLKIKNAGFSLNPQDADRILDPYYTTKADGTGLGLSISRRTVAAHGGRITVRAVKPDRVEIAVYLPRAQPEGASTDKDAV